MTQLLNFSKFILHFAFSFIYFYFCGQNCSMSHNHNLGLVRQWELLVRCICESRNKINNNNYYFLFRALLVYSQLPAVFLQSFGPILFKQFWWLSVLSFSLDSVNICLDFLIAFGKTFVKKHFWLLLELSF